MTEERGPAAEHIVDGFSVLFLFFSSSSRILSLWLFLLSLLLLFLGLSCGSILLYQLRLAHACSPHIESIQNDSPGSWGLPVCCGPFLQALASSLIAKSKEICTANITNKGVASPVKGQRGRNQGKGPPAAAASKAAKSMRGAQAAGECSTDAS